MNNLISIVLPIYKSKPFLHRLNNSLVGQTYSSIEIIYVNDGCPEGSGDLIEEFALRDSRIKVIHQENQGAVAAVNRGLSEARGEYIMFIDADDWIELNTCELAIDIAVKNNVDMVFWLNIKEFENQSVPYSSFFPESKLFKGEEIKFLRRRMMGLINEELNNPISTDAFNAGWGKLYRTDKIKLNNIKWTDTKLVGSSDVLFNASLMPFIDSAYYLNVHLHHYNRVNPNSLTKNYSNTMRGKFENLFLELQRIINTHYSKDNHQEFQLALNNRIALSTINISLGFISGGINIQGYKLFKDLINSNPFKSSYHNLKLNYLPFYFRPFFFACKHQITFVGYIFLYAMSKMRKK